MSAVVLGITGSIAAYKAPLIASALIKRGVEVYPAMTEAATRFIAPLTLETVCARPVACALFSRETPYEVEHIALAKRADVFLVAPASANFIAKMAAGIADDLLTSTILATRAHVIIAPAMNTNMWANPITQENVARLQARGVEFILPESGRLACGDEGAGRLAEVEDIVGRTLLRLEKRGRDFAGVRVLISAGPTREAIDPVRFLSNRSSGKMGYALAGAAALRGADVTMVSGPVTLGVPYGVKRVSVTTAAQMCDAILDHIDAADVLIMAAAVADYTVASASEHKLKKGADMALELVRTKDILMEASKRKGDRVFVGFAAETRDLERYALDKLARKGLDMIVANDVSREDAGFESDNNAVSVYHLGGARRDIPLSSKAEIAHCVLDELKTHIAGR